MLSWIKLAVVLEALMLAPVPAFSADKADFWSFKPAEKPTLPRVKNRIWPRNPVDLFVLLKIEEKQMHPSPEMDRRTLIRRLFFDLTGLPPSTAEVARFLRKGPKHTYESRLRA